MGLIVLETLDKEYDYAEIDEFPYDEDYMIYRGDGVDYDSGSVGFAKDAAIFVVDALKKGGKQLANAEGILSRFKNVSVSLSKNCMEENMEPLNEYNRYVMSLMTDEEFLQQKISILDENDSQDTAIEIYDSLLGKEVAGWTLEKFVKKYARFDKIVHRYAKLLEDCGNIDGAVEILEMHGKYDSDYSELAQEYYELLKRTGNIEKQRNQALLFFKNCGNEQNKIQYYHDLKKIVPLDSWPSVLLQLLLCRSKYSPVHDMDWLLQIYDEEGMKDELRNQIVSMEQDCFDKQGDNLRRKISYFLSFKHAFSDTERDVVSNMFTLELYNTASNYDSKTYDTLMSSVRMLSKVDKESKNRMDKFVQYLKTEFSRRPRLIELIRKNGYQ